MGAPRTTFRDPDTGRWTRVCCDCKETKDLELDFYKARRDPTGRGSDWNYQCKPCKVVQLRELNKRRRDDPDRGPELRAMYARLAREWRARYPERALANRKRYVERLRKDPQRYTRSLENRRIEYRLRAEREGRTVRNAKAAMIKENVPELPAKPLAEFLLEMAASRDSIDQLAEELGFTPRSLFAWKTGERQRVRLDLADQILTNAGLMWWEVWSEEEFPELHEELAA